MEYEKLREPMIAAVKVIGDFAVGQPTEDVREELERRLYALVCGFMNALAVRSPIENAEQAIVGAIQWLAENGPTTMFTDDSGQITLEYEVPHFLAAALRSLGWHETERDERTVYMRFAVEVDSATKGEEK